MPTYAPRLRVVSKKIHFLDCSCECDRRRFELQRALDAVHVPGLVCESRSFNATVDRAAVIVKYTEYRAIGHPKGICNGEFGHVGDIFIDLTPLSHKLYAKMSLDQWELWPGPLIVSNALRHPLFPRQTLSCWLEGETQTLGWHVGKYSKLKFKDYNTPVHDVIATCLPTHSPKTSRTNLKRKWLSHFDFNDGPQAKKARAQPDSVSGRGSSVSSISDCVWRGLPTTMHQNPDSTREEMTIPYVTQPSSHQDSSLDSAPSPPAPSRASAIIVSHLKTSVSTAPSISPRRLPGSYDTVSMRSPQVPCPIVPEDANVDAPARADLASLNGPSMDVAKPSALLPTPNLMKAIDVHASPPPEVPVTSLEPCAITSQQPNAPFCQSDTTNSDPMPTAMPSAGDHPVITNPNELGDPVLSVPNLSEVASRELSNECIDGKSSVPTSQSDNASPPISSSQGSPEPCLVSEDSTNEASLIHDTAHVHKSFAAPSSGDFDASDQGNGISVIPIPQSEFVSSAVKIKIASREVLEGRIASIGQLEISPNIDAVECAGADEVLKVDSVNESPRILMSIASDLLEESNADIDGEKGNSSFLALFGDFPTTSPLEQQVKDLEAMLNEDHLIRGLLSNEEDEPPSNDSTSAPSISVDINADIGEREEVPSLEASAIGDPNPCPLPTDLDRWRIEVVYARSEMQTELMCRLCLASSPEHISILPGDTPFHILAGHCREDHSEYYDLLVDLDVDQLQAIQARLGGLVS